MAQNSHFQSMVRHTRSRSTIPRCRCSTRCAMILASTIRASAAASANAAPVRCTSTGRRCAPAPLRWRRSPSARSPRSPVSARPRNPHPLQTAWIEEQVNQCAYCISGWIMTGAELLARNPHPTDDEIREAFADLDLPLRNARCGGQGRQARLPEGVRRKS